MDRVLVVGFAFVAGFYTAAVFSRTDKTGNSGANPGRPRRCDQALDVKNVAAKHSLKAIAPDIWGEKARFAGSLGVRRPTNALYVVLSLGKKAA